MNVPAEPLPLFLTVDVGPDDAVLGHGHERAPQWERTTAGLALLDALLSAPVAGLEANASWFVRADRHIAATAGDALAVFDRHAGFLQQRRARGDAIGWMPQAYAADQPGTDCADLEATMHRLEARGWRPRAVRMGGCFHDDGSMALLDALGIEVDCSAIPGRQKLDGGWRLDWRGTPQAPYRPSRADYRRPGEPALRLLELPLSVLPIHADYDPQPLPRYLNPAMRPGLLAGGIDALVAGAAYLQCVVHPDELVAPTHGPGHPLIAYSAGACAANLVHWIERARAHGRRPHFATVEEARALPGFEPGRAASRAEAR